MTSERPVRILSATLLAVLAACGPPSLGGGGARPKAPGPEVGPTAKAPPSWADTLRQENLADVLVDFVQGRAVPSNFSSLSQGPELALGSIYVIKARPGKTCSSVDPADFEDARLPDFRVRTPACAVKIFPKERRKEQTVRGGARGGLQLVLGGGRVDAEAIYQLTFDDTAAAFESTSACIDLDRLARAQLPARTCAARYVTGAVLTTITWRDFQKADASVRGTYTALVKVGMDIYGSTSGMTMTPVLSFDTIDLEAFRMVETDAQGFLRIPATDQKSLAIDDLKAELTDSALAALRNRGDDRWGAMFALDLREPSAPREASPLSGDE